MMIDAMRLRYPKAIEEVEQGLASRRGLLHTIRVETRKLDPKTRLDLAMALTEQIVNSTPIPSTVLRKLYHLLTPADAEIPRSLDEIDELATDYQAEDDPT